MRLGHLADCIDPQAGVVIQMGSCFPRVILNRPQALNCLNLQMNRSLACILSHLETQYNQDQQVNQAEQHYPAYWLEGAGGRSFCAGGDVKVLYEGHATERDRDIFFREQFALDYRISVSKVVQVANWNGFIMGGGVGLSNYAAFKLASEGTVFAMPEAKIGFYTDVSSGVTLANLRSNIGMYLGLTAEKLRGEEVYASGLANFYVEASATKEIFQQVTQSLRKLKPPFSPELVKQSISLVLSKKIPNEDRINFIFGAENLEQIFARAQSQQTQFGHKIYKTLQSMCPLSLHVIFKLIRQSRHMDSRAIFRRDYVVCHNFISNRNFEIGVRSLLIDKGTKPKWTHSSVSQVKQEQVDSMFKLQSNVRQLQI